jgi:hypothetical protein
MGSTAFVVTTIGPAPPGSEGQLSPKWCDIRPPEVRSPDLGAGRERTWSLIAGSHGRLGTRRSAGLLDGTLRLGWGRGRDPSGDVGAEDTGLAWEGLSEGIGAAW